MPLKLDLFAIFSIAPANLSRSDYAEFGIFQSQIPGSISLSEFPALFEFIELYPHCSALPAHTDKNRGPAKKSIIIPAHPALSKPPQRPPAAFRLTFRVF